MQVGPLGSTIHVLRADAATITELAAIDWNSSFRRVCLDPVGGLIVLMTPWRAEYAVASSGNAHARTLATAHDAGDGLRALVVGHIAFSIDPALPSALLSQLASQLDDLGSDRDGNVAPLEQLFAGNRDMRFYEGLLAGYANAYHVVGHSTCKAPPKELGIIAAFVAAKLLPLRPDLQVRSRRCLIVASGREVTLPPADFAFYAFLARRRQSLNDNAFCNWEVRGLKQQYLSEYRRTTDELNGNLERLENALNRTFRDGHVRPWFEERKCRVNRGIEKELGRELASIYRIASTGQRPNVLSGLAIAPDGIHFDDQC